MCVVLPSQIKSGVAHTSQYDDLERLAAEQPALVCPVRAQPYEPPAFCVTIAALTFNCDFAPARPTTTACITARIPCAVAYSALSQSVAQAFG